MLRKTLLLMILFGVSGLYVWTHLPQFPPLFKLYLKMTQPESEAASPASVKWTNLSLQQIKEQRHEPYRIKPDRRFLLALDEIRQFADPKSASLPPPRFENGRWRIEAGNNQAFEFTELPDFASGLAVLQKAAAEALAGLHIKAPETPPPTPVVGFDPARLRHNLKTLNERWQAGNHDVGILFEAAENLTHWAFVGLDEMEIADAVQARALAFLVLAKTASDQPMAETESMLATRMGYGSHGLALADRLPEDSLWRSYLTRNDDELAKKSREQVSADKYLLLRRLAQSGQTEAWINVIRRNFDDQSVPIHAFATILDSGEFHPRSDIARSLHYLVFYHLLRDSGQKAANDPKRPASSLIEAAGLTVLSRFIDSFDGVLINHFDSVLSKLGGDLNGPFLDQPVFETYYRSYFFSGLYHYGNFLLNQYNSTEAASRFAAVLGNSKQGIAGEFSLWYHRLIAAEQGEARVADLISDLDSLPSLGLPPLNHTLAASLQRLSFGAPEIASTAGKIWPRADSRISHRFELASLLSQSLLDLNEAERIYQSIVRDAPKTNSQVQAWLAHFNGNDAQLLAMARDDDLPPNVRGKALSLADDDKALASSVQQAYQELVQRVPDDWTTLSYYLEFLKKRKDYQAIVERVVPWIEHYGRSSGGFDSLEARVMLSSALLAQGKKQKAWNALKDVIGSDYGMVLRQGVKVLSALGDEEKATQLALHAVERYPSSLNSLTSLLEVLWQQKANDDAARLLKQWPHRISESDWSWTVGDSFVRQFGGRPKEAEQAFGALIRTGIDQWSLQGIAAAIATQGDSATAFQLQSQLRWNGPGYLEMLVKSYRYLKEAKGKDTALAWLNPQIPSRIRNMASMIYFGQHEYDLLWDLIPDPEAGDYPEAVWLYRAAASLAQTDLAEDRRRLLIDHYRSESSDDYHRLGRYLLKLIDEPELTAQTLAGKEICETAFFLGWRAKSERRYHDAADWFLTSVATGLQQNGEYRWSFEQLYLWHNQGLSLKVLADRGA
jgi:tetratricopeptide (TPR) repeat protein